MAPSRTKRTFVPIVRLGGNEVAFGIAIDAEDNIYACPRNRHAVGKYVISKR